MTYFIPYLFTDKAYNGQRGSDCLKLDRTHICLIIYKGNISNAKTTTG